MRRHTIFVALAVAALTGGGCRKETLPLFGPEDGDGSIKFSIPDTATKGHSIHAANLVEEFGESGINIAAYRNGLGYFANDEKLLFKDGSWKTRCPYYWPSDLHDSLDVLAWAGASIDAVERHSFHYALPQSNNSGDDAKRQEDLIVARFRGANRKANPEGIPLNFKHVLSSIKIQVGKANAGCLQSVILDGISSEADYRMEDTEAWGNYGPKKSYMQAFHKDIKGNLSDSNIQNLSSEEDGTIFMMIPQELDSAKLKVIYVLNGKEESEVFDSELPQRWEAGKQYTYTLSILGGLDISLCGEIAQQFAHNLSFRNDGTSPCYIRTTLVGSWENAGGELIKPASGGNTRLTRPPHWEDFWAFDPESHIYYYRYPIRGGESTSVALLDSLSIADGPDGTMLNMKILVQAIKYDPRKSNVKEAIGEANGFVEQLYNHYYDETD